MGTPAYVCPGSGATVILALENKVEFIFLYSFGCYSGEL